MQYNFFGRVSLLQIATVTGISTNWFENFQRFELWRVIFPGIFSKGVENWLIRVCGSFEQSWARETGGKIARYVETAGALKYVLNKFHTEVMIID